MNCLRRLRKSEKGFTLIEILVVLAILGALAAVAIPNVIDFFGKGETEADGAELHNIQAAVLALMGDARVNELDSQYPDIASIEDAQAVTAGEGAYTLDDYILGNVEYEFRKAYDITINGLVTPTSE